MKLSNPTFIRRGILSVAALAAALIAGPARADEPIIGAVQMVAEHEWFRTVELGMQAAVDAAGAKLLVANAQGQVDNEAAMIDTFVARGVDAILISALNSDASVPALQRAVDAGIKIVNYNTTINSPIMEIFVGVDNYELGAQMGRYVVDYVTNEMGGTAKIALLTIPKYEVGVQRREGFVDAISKLAGIEIVAEQEGEAPEQAANTLETILQGNPDISLVWTANEGGVVGAITAVAAMGSDVKIFGTDMSLQVAAAFENQGSGLVAVSTQDPYSIGNLAVKLALDALNGVDVPGETIVPLELYEADNADAVAAYLTKYRELAN
jgi:ABC-type sugar transport system substrate-binding protein